MPYKNPVICLKCETTESHFWTNAESLGVICHNCINEAKKDNDESDNIKEECDEKPTKKKTRSSKSYKTRLNASVKSATLKGKGRRGLFKRIPIKAPTSTATVVTSDYVFHKGSYIQIGDIVSLTDENNDCYYAQIIGLLTDQYCNKSAILQWLLPTTESPSPNEEFDPATYIIGPEEIFPRKLDYMDFIMHAPSDYYKTKNTPYSTGTGRSESGFIWTRLNTIKR